MRKPKKKRKYSAEKWIELNDHENTKEENLNADGSDISSVFEDDEANEEERQVAKSTECRPHTILDSRKSEIVTEDIANDNDSSHERISNTSEELFEQNSLFSGADI